MRINLSKSQCVITIQAIRMIKQSFNSHKLKNNKEIKKIRLKINKIENKLNEKIPADYYKDEFLKLQLLIAMNFKK